MAKTYVDKEKLEIMLREYGVTDTCSYIMDMIESVSAKEVASTLSVHELRTVLEDKEEVFATQVWQKSDVSAAMKALNIKPDNNVIMDVMCRAKAPLEDCSDNWDRLHTVIRECIGRIGK